MYGGPLFSTKNKSLRIKNDRKLITDFLIYECLHLTGPEVPGEGGGWAFGYFLGGYVLPGTPNWHPILEKISPKIDTPF